MIYTLTGITVDPKNKDNPFSNRRFGYFLTLEAAHKALDDAIVYDWTVNCMDGPDPGAFLLIEAQMPGVQDEDGWEGYVATDHNELYEASLWCTGPGDDGIDVTLVPREKWPAWAFAGYNFTFDLKLQGWPKGQPFSFLGLDMATTRPNFSFMDDDLNPERLTMMQAFLEQDGDATDEQWRRFELAMLQQDGDIE